MSDPSVFTHEMKAINTYLAAVREALGDGNMPDLAGLEKRVGALCENLLQADKAVQEQFKADLGLLLKNVDECGEHLRAWYQSRAKAGVTDGGR